MSGHTPGPWRWMNDETLVGDHGRRPVVLTHSPNGLTTRGHDGLLEILTPEHPNARLIAAAPELLDAGRAVLRAADAFHDDTAYYIEVRRDEIEALRAVIAKTEGAL